MWCTPIRDTRDRVELTLGSDRSQNADDLFSEILVPREQPTDKNGEKTGSGAQVLPRVHLRKDGTQHGHVAPRQ